MSRLDMGGTTWRARKGRTTHAMAVRIGLVSAHAGAAFKGFTLPALVGAVLRATCQRASVSLSIISGIRGRGFTAEWNQRKRMHS